tara:strand:+ start:22 stop:348 length:327 start_codon:yes stop_codon:yes gene_type:complete
MKSSIEYLTNENFSDHLENSTLPVLVDFWAEWCGPCKMIAPILEQLSEDYVDRVSIAKVDVDAEKEIAENFNIRGIPTLILFKNGEPEATKVGALSKTQLADFIDSNI